MQSHFNFNLSQEIERNYLKKAFCVCVIALGNSLFFRFCWFHYYLKLIGNKLERVFKCSNDPVLTVFVEQKSSAAINKTEVGI